MTVEVDPRRLLLFRVVVSEGGIRGAAEALGLTQSAVSQQLTKFELELGHPIVTRARNRITPTALGLRLLTQANRVAEALTSAGALLEESPASERPLRLAIETALIEDFPLPALVSSRLVAIERADRENAAELLQPQRVDAALVSPALAKVRPSLRAVGVLKERRVLIVPARDVEGNSSGLGAVTWFQTPTNAEALMYLFEWLGVRGEVTKVESTGTALALARAGFGGTVATAQAVTASQTPSSLALDLPGLELGDEELHVLSFSPQSTALIEEVLK